MAYKFTKVATRAGTVPPIKAILVSMIDTGLSTRRVCLFDVYLLGALTFNTAGVNQKTLKDIF